MHDVTDTIPWDDVCFIDCETRSEEVDGIADDVTKTSTRRYASHAWPIVITWAYGLDGEVLRWEAPDVTRPPTVDALPMELRKWDGYFAAWNSGFDRAILDRYFQAGIEGWLDMMAHAAYNNLPLGLDRAAKSCSLGGKVSAGKKLIRKFCSPNGETPQSEREEFWVSEKINDRGLPIDRAMAAGGARLAKAYIERLGEVVDRITEGEMYSIKQYVKQRAWVWDRVKDNPFVFEHMVEAEREKEDGEVERVLKMDRPRITKMIAALTTLDKRQGLTDGEFQALELLEEREWGASAAPMKFQKMLDMAVSNRVPNQYVFSGATQTGRYSSRGVQVHNMTRSTVGDIDAEEDACAYLVSSGVEGVDLARFEKEFGNPGKALSRLIRPTICAEQGKRLVWGDWSNIEARGLPWLANAEHRLDLFRKIDADPAEPDVYLHAAAGMYGGDPYEMAPRKKEDDVKDLRQKGKIAELALGFLGGVGALQSMAANYGMAFDASEAKDIVDRWRAANRWAVDFGDECWNAFLSAVRDPGTMFAAGKVTYQAIDMNGEVWVIAYLPDGRPLMYRDVRERVDITYDPFDPTVVLEKKSKLSFDGEDGIKFLWRGILVENATQAICASVLRRALVTIENGYSASVEIVAHTHDEIVTQVDDTEAGIELGKTVLEGCMLSRAPWMKGLPLGADITDHVWYSKAIED